MESDRTIGSYVFRRGTLAGAIAAFGEPTARRKAGAGCEARWQPLGLVIVFSARGTRSPCEAARARFTGAVITGPGWQTAERLEIGAPIDRIRALYPTAEEYPGEYYSLLTSGSKSHLFPALAAKAKGGRIVALYVN